MSARFHFIRKELHATNSQFFISFDGLRLLPSSGTVDIRPFGSGRRTKHSSAVDNSLVQLSTDLNLAFQSLRKRPYYSTISCFKLANIRDQILSDKYVLSPLQVLFMDKCNLYDLLMDKKLDYPDVPKL